MSFYLRHSPLESGKWRLTPYVLNKIRSSGTDMGTRLVGTSDGFRMSLVLSDWVDQTIYVTGRYEPSVVEVAKRILRPGDLAVDIGANIGFFSLLFATLVGKEGRVYAFEPIDSTRNRLARNVALNSQLPITIRAQAVSDEIAKVSMNRGPDSHSGIASLRSLTESAGEALVECIPLDQALGIETPVRLLKIDVEGAEMKALRGATEIIKRHHPDIILEMTDDYLKQLGSSAEEVFQFLKSHGYTLRMICYDSLPVLDKLSSELPPQFNVWATVREI